MLTLVDRACRPVAGTAVDLWHVDAMGGYSDPTEGHAEFRGTQRSDSGGTVEFVTIYPGWYAGRSVHLHVWVRAATPFATQVFFPDETNALVRARPPYSANTVAVTRNADDPYFVQLRGLTQATVVESTPALAARLQLVLPG